MDNKVALSGFIGLLFKGDKLLIEAMNLSRSFNIKYVNKRISILLYTKDLPKHFIFYIVTLLEKIL